MMEVRERERECVCVRVCPCEVLGPMISTVCGRCRPLLARGAGWEPTEARQRKRVNQKRVLRPRHLRGRAASNALPGSRQ